MLTAHLLAKINGFGLVKIIKSDCRKTAVKVPDARDFMPPEAPEYDPSVDVFSFAGIILHTFNQCWPKPIDLMVDSRTTKVLMLSEVDRRQHWLDKMAEEVKRGDLTLLVEECLNNEPAMRP